MCANMVVAKRVKKKVEKMKDLADSKKQEKDKEEEKLKNKFSLADPVFINWYRRFWPV